MPTLQFSASCKVRDSFRVRQVAGMFDVPLDDRLRSTVRGELPSLDEPWSIGVITGPSGSGKSLLARRAYGAAVERPRAWPRDRAIVDCLGDLSATQATRLFTAVGLGSPMAWIKPHRALSRGEQFRADLARGLAGTLNDTEANVAAEPRLIVIDEYTSVVDRVTARTASAAVSRAIRSGFARCRLVAVTCHSDVARWLSADWVLDMSDGQLRRGRLRPPPLRLRLFRVDRAAWRLFEPHHYLAGRLNAAARCYVAFAGKHPAAFCATLAMIGRRDCWRASRLVTLPPFQGIGVGTRVLAAVARIHAARNERLRIVTCHAAIVAHCRRSDEWRLARIARRGSFAAGPRYGGYAATRGRAMASFEYVTEATNP